MRRLETAAAAIDEANAADPNRITVRGTTEPLALAHGRLAAEWIDRLVPDADDTLKLAARAHHLRRWELPRADYPEGRAGYLRWRRDQKRRHAADVEALLVVAGYDADDVSRVQALIRREGPESQPVEDAACLVFLETQLSTTAERLDHEHMLDVIRKTAKKMSPQALARVSEIPLTTAEHALLEEALTSPRGSAPT